jgi:surfactin synthase thioesterase subunit
LAFPKPSAGEEGSGFLSLKYPSLILFGSVDHFTSAKKLKQWAERLSSAAKGHLQWQCFDSGGHFWREGTVMEELQSRIRTWSRSATIGSART